MKHSKVFLLSAQRVIEQRIRSFVWFAMSIIYPMIFIMFWKANFAGSGQKTLGGWSQSDLNSYYILLIIVSNVLISHVEEHIAFIDIQQGRLSAYLLKPISYFWYMMQYELPYRLMQGSFGIITGIFLAFILKGFTIASFNGFSILPIISILLLAFFVSFTFKMILGISAFWLIDISGTFNIITVAMILFGSTIMPLDLFPPAIKIIAHLTPYPWIIYYPIRAIQGGLSMSEMQLIIGVQCVWICGLGILYKYMWRKGIRKFTAVGQ